MVSRYFLTRCSKVSSQVSGRPPEKNGLRVAAKNLPARSIELLEPIDQIDGLHIDLWAIAFAIIV